MNNSYYEHSGKHLTRVIAAEFIYKSYCDGKVSEPRICQELFEHHNNGGGLAPAGRLFNELDKTTGGSPEPIGNLLGGTDSDEMKVYEKDIGSIVRSGLLLLKANQCAVEIQEERKTWWIRNIDNRYHQTQTIGCGSESVYVYYFKAERDIEFLSVPVWERDPHVPIIYPCNVGMSESDHLTRVNTKTKDASEPPVIALIMKTDAGKLLESIIQRILTYNGRQCESSQRTDWYYTSPEEVKSIFGYITAL